MSAGTRARRVVVAGGGTGGHLYPGIAVARELQAQRPGTTVTFAGTARGIESRVVVREGFELDVIRSAGLKGKSTGHAACVARRCCRCRRSMRGAWCRAGNRIW